MSINLAMQGMIHCNGDGRWPCSRFYDAGTNYTLREARQEARQQGWQVNVPQRWGRRRLDFCPEHAERKD